MINRIEIYAAILAIILLGDLACYLFGRYQQAQRFHVEQLAADAKELRVILDHAKDINLLDDQARVSAENFITRVNQGLDHVSQKFSKLPNIIVDTHGCGLLGDEFRLRWVAAADLSAGSPVESAGGAPKAVPSAPVRSP